MLKTNKKTLALTSVIILLPILIGIIFWSKLPDTMATHFGFDNEANGFSSRTFAVFGLPLILLALQWFLVTVTLNDPKKQNISPKILRLCLWITPVVSIICAASIYPYNLGMNMDMTFFASLFLGGLLIIIGNFLPKARQNYVIGFRLPWTLANEENWNRTHRLAGYACVTAGILTIVLALCGIIRDIRLIVPVIAAAGVPCVYSFWLHVRKGL